MLAVPAIFLLQLEPSHELILVEAIRDTAQRHRMIDLRRFMQVIEPTEMFD